MVDHGGELEAQRLPEGGRCLDEDIVAFERGGDDLALMWPGESEWAVVGESKNGGSGHLKLFLPNTRRRVKSISSCASFLVACGMLTFDGQGCASISVAKRAAMQCPSGCNILGWVFRRPKSAKAEEQGRVTVSAILPYGGLQPTLQSGRCEGTDTIIIVLRMYRSLAHVSVSSTCIIGCSKRPPYRDSGSATHAQL